MTPVTSAEARLGRTSEGDDYVSLNILSLRFYNFELSPLAAEKLLYDLHSISQTLRGVSKPLKRGDRLKNLIRALRGR